MAFGLAILAATIISSLSLIGLLILKLKLKSSWMQPALYFSAGTLLGTAVFHLLLESLQTQFSTAEILTSFAIGAGAAIVMEHLFQHPSFHISMSKAKSAAIVNTFAALIHNFLDGVSLGISFLVSPSVGLATTIGIFLHEIPHEMANGAILLNTGWGTLRAVLINLSTALLAVVGVVIVFTSSGGEIAIEGLLLAFIAGQLLYIGIDTIRETYAEGISHSRLNWGLFLFGILLMLGLKLVLG